MSQLDEQISGICRSAREASRALAACSTDEKNALLAEIADRLEKGRADLAEANAVDLEKATAAGLSGSMLDRLKLDDGRIDKMIVGVRQVIALPDPVGGSLRQWDLYNDVHMEKVRVPLGVIGIIYESRPNVTIDAGVLCLKTGNVPILRGGKEAFESNRTLVRLMQEAAEAVGLPPATASFIPTTEREAIPVFCKMDSFVDLMIPRGGHGLIETVVTHARMPVIKHFHGVCHVYVHAAADLEMAKRIVINAKCQRPGVCNAMETLLIDRAIAKDFLNVILPALESEGVEIRGEADLGELAGTTFTAPDGWDVEYLDKILGVRLVDSLAEAIDHIETYGSHHTDTIVTEDREAADTFLSRVDSAAVFWNASTRFSDGGEFGFGAEIGISTDKIHARGPMGLEELTSYKYIGRGNGQVRE
jgi:glutamate-5-semialdehyde dehydrogenase